MKTRTQGRESLESGTSAEPLGLTVGEAAVLMNVSRSTVYRLARRGELPTVRFGRVLLIPRRAIEALFNF